MPTNRIGDAALRALKPQAAPYKVSDGEGLHLQFAPTGGKLWRMACRFAGKHRRRKRGLSRARRA
jgi:hypothetical protein